jgi:hypothetical protein
MLECMLQVRLADPNIFFRVLGPYGPRLLSLDKRQVVHYSIKGGMPPQNQANPANDNFSKHPSTSFIEQTKSQTSQYKFYRTS